MNLKNLIIRKMKSIYDSIKNQDFKKNVLNALPFWIGAIITGLVSVFYAKLFSWAELLSNHIYDQNKWLFLIITPASFVIAWWLVKKYSPFSRGSGIPQVSASIELAVPKNNNTVSKLLSLRVIFIKVLSSIIMIFGGGAIGREGPTIQISASIFKKINDLLPEWYPKISKRNMIVTGAAAGLASAFNTPLGGIVFAIEELTKTHFSFFKSALLTGVIIAGLTALNLSGPYLYLGFPELNNTSRWIVLTIIPIAILTGVSGAIMGSLILYLQRMKKLFKGKYQIILYTILSGIVIAALAIFVDTRILGSGKDIILTSLFSDQKYLDWNIPILRIIGTVISFSVGAAGGIFGPSLSAGAAIGAAASQWLHLSPTDSNLIILCGMVGFLTGITRSPFTSSILVIEMTNNHNIIFNLMLAALAANLFANFISKHSFYDQLKIQYTKEIQSQES